MRYDNYTFAPSLTNMVFCLLRTVYDLSSPRAFFNLVEYYALFLINCVQSIGFGPWNEIKINKSCVYVAGEFNNSIVNISRLNGES